MRIRRWFLLLLLLLLTALAGGAWWLLGDLPSVATVGERVALPSVRIVDRHGVLLYDVLDAQGGRHTPLPAAAIPPIVRQAVIATEDANFYAHPGVDVRGIARALWINARGGEVLAGGSTITQQVARNLLLDAEERATRSLRRKLRESWLAWRLTRRYSKDDILALYLNQSYFGAQAYGIEAAAQTYFGKPAAALTPAEAALLIGLVQAPALYNPFTDPEAAQARQRVVLDLLLAQGWLSVEQHALAQRQPLRYAGEPFPIRAPHFVMQVRRQIDALFTREQIIAAGGLTVVTTLDWERQQAAEQVVHNQLARLNSGADGINHNAHNAALVALDPQTGDILTLVGNADYFDSAHGGAINMALAARQPGSALKPLIYATVLALPQPWTAATSIADVRTSFVTHDGLTYIPINFSRTEHGPVLLRDALASSLNIPAVKALDVVGVSALVRRLEDYGLFLGDPGQYDLALALGGGALRPLDLTAAYAVFANGGRYSRPRAILTIADAAGNVRYSAPPPTATPVLDARIAWLISDILSDDSARALGFERNSVLNIDRPAAVKTGTTNDYRDNWTIGYTPDLVVGVWVGNADHAPMVNVTGLSGAGPIWHQFIRRALAGTPARPFARPQGLIMSEVCRMSGLLPTSGCPYRRREWFLAGTQPTAPDTFFVRATLDTRSGRLADDRTPPAYRQAQWALDVPPNLQPWARAAGWPVWDDLLLTAQTAPPAADAALWLIDPPPNAVYRLSERLPASAQQIVLEALTDRPVLALRLLVNGQPLATPALPPWRVWWTLTPGTHTLSAEAQLADGTHVTAAPVTITVHPLEGGN